MHSKANHLNTTRSAKPTHAQSRGRSMEPRPVRSVPSVYRDEKMDVESALSPFWAWRITSH
jgi:hypothetical protein